MENSEQWSERNQAKNKTQGSLEEFKNLEHQATPKQIVSIIIGHSGHGKSTLINYFTNYFRGGTLNDKKVAIPTENYKSVTEKEFSHTERNATMYLSQTENCSHYTFVDQKSNQYIFIDTPGLSDTQGSDQDDKNIEKIFDTLCMTKILNGIIVIQNGSESRLTSSVKNALVRLRNCLPLSARENIILILTNSPEFSTFDEDCIPLKVKKTYLMDNSAFNVPAEDIYKISRRQKNILNMKWEMSMDVIEELMNDLLGFNQIQTKDFQIMKDEINHVKSSFHHAKIILKNWLDIRDKISEIKIEKDALDADALANQDYTLKRTVFQTEFVNTSYHNTICSRCSTLCDENCGLEYTNSTNAEIFIGCSCMNGSSSCEVCKCGYSLTYYSAVLKHHSGPYRLLFLLFHVFLHSSTLFPTGSSSAPFPVSSPISSSVFSSVFPTASHLASPSVSPSDSFSISPSVSHSEWYIIFNFF